MRLSERIIRYGVAGIAVSLCYTLIVIGLVHLLPALGAINAAMLAFVIVQPIGLVIHGTMTYPGTLRAHAHLPRVGARFVLTNFMGFFVSTGTMALATRALHLSYLWGLAFAWGLIPIMNFTIYMVWVFRHPQAARGA